MKNKVLTAVLCSLLLASCSSTATKESTEKEASTSPSSQTSFVIDTLVTGLENPWGITWLDSQTALFTERSGDIRILKNNKLSASKIGNIPEPYLKGQSGYLDIQAHPDYKNNGWIYLTYSKKGPGGGSTALARFKLQIL